MRSGLDEYESASQENSQVLAVDSISMVVSELIESIVDLPGEFAEVIAQGPIEAFLVGMGALLVGIPMLVFGVLVLGAVVDLIRPDSTAVRHP